MRSTSMVSSAELSQILLNGEDHLVYVPTPETNLHNIKFDPARQAFIRGEDNTVSLQLLTSDTHKGHNPAVTALTLGLDPAIILDVSVLQSMEECWYLRMSETVLLIKPVEDDPELGAVALEAAREFS